MKFPMEKYKFYVTKDTVIAVSSFAGRRVKGVAKCDPRDSFDLEKGKELAAARCDAKISNKRYKRANEKLSIVTAKLEKYNKELEKALNYYKDAQERLFDSIDELQKLEESFK